MLLICLLFSCKSAALIWSRTQVKCLITFFPLGWENHFCLCEKLGKTPLLEKMEQHILGAKNGMQPLIYHHPSKQGGIWKMKSSIKLITYLLNVSFGCKFLTFELFNEFSVYLFSFKQVNEKLHRKVNNHNRFLPSACRKIKDSVWKTCREEPDRDPQTSLQLLRTDSLRNCFCLSPGHTCTIRQFYCPKWDVGHLWKFSYSYSHRRCVVEQRIQSRLPKSVLQPRNFTTQCSRWPRSHSCDSTLE